MISFKRRIYYLCLLLNFSAILVGCGDSDKATVYPTGGIVLYDGKPMVGGGAISFVPISKQEGKTAGGTIKEDGTFVMDTYGEGDGSIAGEFRVVVYQTTVQEPEAVIPDNDGSVAGKNFEPTSSEPIPIVSKDSQIPLIYSDVVKSPITVKIEPDGENESLKIELKPL